MSKTICNTVIQLEFLGPDGKEFLVTVPTDYDAEDLARVIRSHLHKLGVVLNDVYIDHEFKKEDE